MESPEHRYDQHVSYRAVEACREASDQQTGLNEMEMKRKVYYDKRVSCKRFHSSRS